MKEILVLSLTILLNAIGAFGQSGVTNIPVISKGSVCKTNRINIAITLCGMQNDTLTIAQLKSCSELIILDSLSREILSYTLSFTSSDGADLYEYHGTDNKLTADGIDYIITSGIERFLIHQVYLAGGSDNEVQGHRWFVVKLE